MVQKTLWGLKKDFNPNVRMWTKKKIYVKANWTYIPAVFVVGKYYFT